VIDTGSGELSGTPAATTPLGEIVARFIDELGELDGDTRCRVGELQADAQQARFNIEIQRAPEGRRALPELDHRRRPRR
jgi:hypothetical protein